MSGYLNEATLIGNLGQDPEARAMQTGGRVVTLKIATSENWKDRHSGERKQRTEWHRAVIFNEGLGDIAEKYLEKGAKVLVRGALRTRKWQDQSGADRYSTEIHLTPYNGTLTFLSSKKDSDRAAGDTDEAREPATPDAGRAPEGGDLDDDNPSHHANPTEVIMSDTSPLTERLRPHVQAIENAAQGGDEKARQIITLYGMHMRSPQDPGAFTLCEAAFDDRHGGPHGSTEPSRRRKSTRTSPSNGSSARSNAPTPASTTRASASSAARRPTASNPTRGATNAKPAANQGSTAPRTC